MSITDWLENRLILKAYRGSYAFNLNTPTSDYDLGGVFIPPIEYYVGLKQFNKDNEHYVTKNYTNYPEYKNNNEPADVAFYSIKKFVYLASSCNPGIIETLFTPENSIIYINNYGKELIKHRDLFLNKKVKYTFGHYAENQLKLIDNNNNHNSHGKHQQLIDKYGFDTKNASCLIRLLKMAIEILQGKGCNVDRYDDREYLLDIKNGGYTLEEIKNEADILFGYLEDAYNESNLPDESNKEKINQLLCDITISAIYEWKDLDR